MGLRPPVGFSPHHGGTAERETRVLLQGCVVPRARIHIREARERVIGWLRGPENVVEILKYYFKGNHDLLL